MRIPSFMISAYLISIPILEKIKKVKEALLDRVKFLKCIGSIEDPRQIWRAYRVQYSLPDRYISIFKLIRKNILGVGGYVKLNYPNSRKQMSYGRSFNEDYNDENDRLVRRTIHTPSRVMEVTDPFELFIWLTTIFPSNYLELLTRDTKVFIPAGTCFILYSKVQEKLQNGSVDINSHYNSYYSQAILMVKDKYEITNSKRLSPPILKDSFVYLGSHLPYSGDDHYDPIFSSLRMEFAIRFTNEKVMKFVKLANKINNIRVTQAGIYLMKFGEELVSLSEYRKIKELPVTSEHLDQARDILNDLEISPGSLYNELTYLDSEYGQFWVR